MWNKPKWLNWTASFLFAFSAVLLMYGVIYLIVHLPIFPLREVKVEGRMEHVTHEQIKLITEKYLNGNFFTLDLERTRDAFEKLPWARKVSVRRYWPDKLVVNIEEHQALARWGNIALVNTYGELFHAASDDDLPLFYGPGDGVLEVTQAYADYRTLLMKADMHITQVHLSPRRAWEIKTKEGMQIALGRVDMIQRLNTFVKGFNSTLKPLRLQIAYADLRYPNGFAIRKPKALKRINNHAATINS